LFVKQNFAEKNAASLNLPQKWHPGEQLLRGSRTTLEQTALRVILFLRGILG
jgi:hypothetical protein